MLSPDQIAALAADDRERYLIRLKGHDLDNGTDHHRAWRLYANRCAYTDPISEDRCTAQRYAERSTCLRHLSLEEIDPELIVRNRSVAAKIRLAEMLTDAVDQLERIINAPEDAVPPAVRLKAIDSVMDRAHLPRQTAQSVDHSGSVEMVHTDAATVIAGRLDRLAESVRSAAPVINGELEVLEIEEAEEATG
jgi:hypothetical protein